MSGWTHEDQERALAEGWGVFDNSDYGLRIERFDSAAIFASDVEAIKHVRALSDSGDALARKALRFVQRDEFRRNAE